MVPHTDRFWCCRYAVFYLLAIVVAVLAVVGQLLTLAITVLLLRRHRRPSAPIENELLLSEAQPSHQPLAEAPAVASKVEQLLSEAQQPLAAAAAEAPIGGCYILVGRFCMLLCLLQVAMLLEAMLLRPFTDVLISRLTVGADELGYSIGVGIERILVLLLLWLLPTSRIDLLSLSSVTSIVALVRVALASAGLLYAHAIV